MTVYIVLLIVIFLYGVFLQLDTKSNKNRLLFLFLSFLSFTIVMGLRAYNVGTDTASYMTIFKITSSIPLHDILTNFSLKVPYFIDYESNASVESGFLLWCKFIHLFSDNPQVFLFVTSGLICFLSAKFIYDNCGGKVFFPTIVFLCESFFMNSLNLVRQMLACAIVLQAYKYLKNKRILKASIIILIAFMVHHTAIVTLILIPLMLFNVKNKRKFFNYMGIVAFLFPLISFYFQNTISVLFPTYANYYVSRTSQNFLGTGTIVLIVTELLGVFYMYHNNFKVIDSDRISLVVLISIIFEILAFKMVIFLRMSLYFRAYLMLFFNQLFESIDVKYRSFVKLTLLCMLVLLYLSYASTDSVRYSFFNF